MTYNWQDKEVTKIWKRITDMEAKFSALENKPNTHEIQQLRARVYTLEKARAAQINLNNQFKLHNHEVKGIKEIVEMEESFWTRLFK